MESVSNFTWQDKTHLACTFSLQSQTFVLKRFLEGKLLLVITDGQRFGNVLTCQVVKTATNEGDLGDEDEFNDMMMNDGGDVILDGDENNAQQEKVEYPASLLLGDRKQQDFLLLFAQTLLK